MWQEMFQPVNCKNGSRYLRTDYIHMFFHVKCLSICIPKTFDTVIYLIFVIRWAKYANNCFLTFSASLLAHK